MLFVEQKSVTSWFCGVFLVLSIGVLLLCEQAQAQFSVDASVDTAVYWQGQKLIDGDSMNYLEGGFANNGEITASRNGSMQIVNVTGDTEDYQYRKELGVTADRIELNVQMNMPAYTNTKDKPNIFYTFYVPLERLEGMTWRAIIGRTYQPVEVSGTITREMPDGPLTKESRWFAFEGNGQSIIFDFNPKGVSSYSDFGPGGVQGMWQVSKKGDHLAMSFGGNAKEYGGTFSSKVVIFEGRHEDFLQHHAHRYYVYFYDLPVTRQFSFGASSLEINESEPIPKYYPQMLNPVPAGDYVPVDTALYNKEYGCGWKSTDDLNILKSESKDAAQSAVSSDLANTFICDLARPGLYVITIRASNPEGDYGPFSFGCNGEKKSDGITIKKDKITTITSSQWLNTDRMELEFKGNWTISTISLQMVLHQNEDYAFRRGFWLVDDFYEPTPVNSNKPNQQPVTHKVAVSELEIPKKIIEPESLPMMKREVLLPSQDAPENAWRYDAFVGGLGVNNLGTFLEYNTREKVERRFKKMKVMGVNTVLVDGFLARHVHRSHLPRVQKKLKEMVEVGHSLGMKVLDHQEFSILWNKEEAMRIMVEGIDYCQRTVAGNLITRGWCLNNPEYRQKYFDWVIQFIEDTNLDGIMIDEVCFHGKKYCGCEHCRRLFTQETGLVLPVEENSGVFDNMESILWKSWLEWRRKSSGDFWIDFRRHVQQSRPNFCIMGYISEGGFQSKWGPLIEGLDLSDSARAIDFLGTEIMSRNVMDNGRYVFSSRKSYNMLREAYGGPIFGLVYSMESPVFAYFGWAMNNMHAQATWSMVSQRKAEEAVKYLNWADNVDKISGRPAVDIAIVFSTRSRDWFEGFDYSHDMYGYAQILSDRHIQHTIITEPCLTLNKLNDYRLVIFPNMYCISDEHISVIRQYVAQGGRVLITGEGGTLDEIGLARDRWAFSDMLGVQVHKDSEVLPKNSVLHSLADGAKVSFPAEINGLTITKPDQVKTTMNVINEAGDILAPAMVSGAFGRGEIFYCVPQLGQVNYQHDTGIRQEIAFEMNEPVKNLLMDVVYQSLGEEPLLFKAIDMPEQVMTTMYQQNSHGKRSRVVHLLNATGVRVKKGDRIPTSKSKPSFPPLTAEMVFEIELPALSECYAASPDYTGRIELMTKKLSSTRYQVTVPKDALKSYTVLYFNEN